MEGALLSPRTLIPQTMTLRHFIPAIALFITPTLIQASPQASSNIAPSGKIIMGIDRPSAVQSPSTSLPTYYLNSSAKKPHYTSSLNDQKIDSLSADTWAGVASMLHKDKGTDFIGVTNLPVHDNKPITQITFHGLTFADGGWFGTNGSIDTKAAIAPQLQYSTDNGKTWRNHPSESDYVSAVSQAGLEANNYTSTFSFPPIHGANAIRLIGTTGGHTPADKNGFVGAREFVVHTKKSNSSAATASSLISIDSVSLILK